MSEQKIKPRAWMALHAGQPVQATVDEAEAEAWSRAGGEVVELYDGPTLWNAVADAAKVERERCAKVCESEPERRRGDGVWACDQQACADAIRAG